MESENTHRSRKYCTNDYINMLVNEIISVEIDVSLLTNGSDFKKMKT